MTVIRATCETCGDAELSVADVHVMVCNQGGQTRYRFRCPKCRMTVVKNLAPAMVDLLVDAGVTITRWDVPFEFDEPRRGAPISHDDVLDAHQRWADDDGFWGDFDQAHGEPA